MRNFDSEFQDVSERQYAYDFDYDVMHHYMIKSMMPLWKGGRTLELGSFQGRFTQRLAEVSDDITCVEAAGTAIEVAREVLHNRVEFVHGTFEDVELTGKFDSIVMTHVLEHVDDPVKVLKRVNDEWLTDGGRFYLICPNAQAPSRQIAVKMGLISHNSAVTEGESKHGHRITYSLDTLERDAVNAGLTVVHRSGIFFKALANFQWDRILKTDIVSKEYLDGCFALGHVYPDLCASIFLACEKG